jgi:hypothetical protein
MSILWRYITPVTSTNFLIKNFLIQSPNNKVTDTKVPNATQCLMLQFPKTKLDKLNILKVPKFEVYAVRTKKGINIKM